MDGLRSAFVLLLLVAACDPSRPEYQGAPAPTCSNVVDGTASYFADVSCTSRPCSLLLAQDDCEVSVDLRQCDVEGAQVVLDGLGGAQVTGAAGLTACTDASVTTDELRFRCDRDNDPCDVAIRRVEPELDLEITSVQILPAAFDAPSGTAAEPLDYRDPITGYLGGAAMLGDTIAVSTNDGAYRSTRCQRALPSRLVFVDRTTLETTTSTAPDCLTLLGADPLGTGFYGLHDDDAPRITRFDRNGRALASAEVDVRTDTNGSRPSAMLVEPGSIYIAYDHRVTQLARIDPTTLRTSTVTVEWPGMIRDLRMIGPDLVLTERVEGLVVRLDPISLKMRGVIPLAHALRPSNDGGAMFHSNESDRLYVTATGEGAALWSIDGPLGGGSAPTFFVESQRTATMWAMTSSPIDDKVWAFGVGPGPEYLAVLYEIDETRRAWAPRSTVVGQGVIRTVFAEGTTRWAFSPWSGTIIRIRPR